MGMSWDEDEFMRIMVWHLVRVMEYEKENCVDTAGKMLVACS